MLESEIRYSVKKYHIKFKKLRNQIKTIGNDYIKKALFINEC